MNPAWRFYKGKAEGASAATYTDTAWSVVNLPNGIEYLSEEASGGNNYQGEVWYRKHFTPDNALKGKKLFLHFEAIMGKSKIWINGTLLTEHLGGYLPVIVDITDHIKWNKDNVIAVWANNSNDPSYPPGKDQEVLDFAYFGGIYRDCWLIAHNPIHITDPNYENEVAGGGTLIAFKKVTEKEADIFLQLHLRNETPKNFKGAIVYQLLDEKENIVAKQKSSVRLNASSAKAFSTSIKINNPHLWSPDDPHLYHLKILVQGNKNSTIDGYRKKIGVRSIEFKGKDGFWLNGKPYPEPLIGANRHQDFAIVGNALSNNIHWRDAKKLRDAGLKVIRNAHYPQDPAFMDACDELGLFVIINTPGWQFWNKDPQFEQLIYKDIRNMVRRDRNRPSVWLWEPILNETHYPDYFAKKAKETVEQEFPYPNSYTACDDMAKGAEYYSVQFSHPSAAANNGDTPKADPSKTYFTREWGDNVDTWNAHNSSSRVYRNWGEGPMLIQAKHYANPSYPFTSYDVLYKTSKQHVGGALWHSFDHQRGYHPDPFYGGLMDVYRQPKYSYYMFKAQRQATVENRLYETGPVLFIANEMTPFSSEDVVVYSNCDEVRLTAFKGGETLTYKNPHTKGMPSPPIVFKEVYNFMQIKARTRGGKQNEVYLAAEGFIDGKKVIADTVYPAYRPEKIILWTDDEGTSLIADGSDFITVVAAVVDKNGTIKRLNNSQIYFEVEGNGELIGDDPHRSSLKKLNWGTAPVLVRSTTQAGTVKIKAHLDMEGSNRPSMGELEIRSSPSNNELLFSSKELDAYFENHTKVKTTKSSNEKGLQAEIDQLKKELNQYKLKEVEKQQEDFGEKRKK
ncbi:glycoside hydrolase family 2 protein [Niabella ginsengisoli]|uniref:Glycoside hydrolase family 2 protein n=1 Tax=Niabella ginsengisoli TaxID=522298 RepID=A0ABS9SNT1_9BACT|nr:glycoside hydrolase family 2 TIM barrel-domain containing protein [Niabella ginsengisoli]MCH5600012.1 hypothetical protein [Niabella ginsengisoli]